MCVTVQMARFIWIDITVSQRTAPRRAVDLDWLRLEKVKSGAGSIPSLPRVLCANLLVGSAQEQLNEESRAVPPGP